MSVSIESYSPPGIRRSFRYRSTRKLAINLKDEIKQLMFPPSGPLCVSEDEGLFKVVMSTFYQHEQMVSHLPFSLPLLPSLPLPLSSNLSFLLSYCLHLKPIEY